MNIALKCLFSTGVHDRGHDYFLNGAVHDIKYSNNELKAVVSGSKDYIVKIVFSEDDENEILDMDYTCRYACDGYNCKHMVAALYKHPGIYLPLVFPSSVPADFPFVLHR